MLYQRFHCALRRLKPGMALIRSYRLMSCPEIVRRNSRNIAPTTARGEPPLVPPTRFCHFIPIRFANQPHDLGHTWTGRLAKSRGPPMVMSMVKVAKGPWLRNGGTSHAPHFHHPNRVIKRKILECGRKMHTYHT